MGQYVHSDLVAIIVLLVLVVVYTLENWKKEDYVVPCAEFFIFLTVGVSVSAVAFMIGYRLAG